MKQTEWLQETKQMRFEEAYQGWTARRLTQEEAARLLGVCARTFRRYIDRYEEDGVEGVRDKRLTTVSHRRTPVEEVRRVVDRYRRSHEGWNVQHYYTWYRRDGGTRSYRWGKNALQAAGAVKKAASRGTPRNRREPAPWPGMLVHQDGSTHEWIPAHFWDLIVTMDDATNFGRAMNQLGVAMIPAYSPEARGRSERAFATHQGRLPKERVLAGITDLAAANAYIRTVYLPAFNAEFAHPAREAGSAFVPCPASVVLDDILCEQEDRMVGKDNCVRLDGRVLQLPPDRHRYHYVKATVKVCRHTDDTVSVFHGPRRLARYDETGQVLAEELPTAA